MNHLRKQLDIGTKNRNDYTLRSQLNSKQHKAHGSLVNPYLRQTIVDHRFGKGTLVPANSYEIKKYPNLRPMKILIYLTKEDREKLVKVSQDWPSLKDFIVEAALEKADLYLKRYPDLMKTKLIMH